MIITDPKGKLKNVKSDDENDSEAETMNWSQSTSTFKGDEFSLDKLRKPYKKRVELHLAEKPKQKNQSQTTHSTQERPLAGDDGVCVHVTRLNGSLAAEDPFSAMFGISEERSSWEIPSTLFEIFEAKDRLYHSDQLVPIKSPLESLSINYHGGLRLTSDRMEIISHGPELRLVMRGLQKPWTRRFPSSPNLLF